MADEPFPYNLCSLTVEEAEILNEKMDAYISKQLSFHGNIEKLENYVIKDSENIVAGIKICFYLQECMFISVLFVDEKYRGKGLGRRLLNYAEDKAKSLGVKLIHLDTFDFQAKDFYFKHGYVIFGILDDCPKGHKRYYLKKILK